MHTVKIVIDRVAVVSSIEGRRQVVTESDAVQTLAHAIKVVVFRQVRNELDELVLVDKDAALGGKEDITSRLSEYCKRESGFVGPDELKVNVFSGLVWDALLGLVNKVGRQNVPAGVLRGNMSRLDVYGQTVGRLVGYREIEDINVGTVDIALLNVRIEHMQESCIHTAGPARDRMAVKPFSVCETWDAV